MPELQEEPQSTTKPFIFGAISGVLFATVLSVIYILTQADDNGPIANCGNLPDDPQFSIRIGDNGKRLPEQTALIDTLSARFVRRFATDSGIVNPNVITGGSISRCALAAVVNSIDPSVKMVDYRLGIDDNNRIVVLFKGGLVNPFEPNRPYEQPLIFMTGRSEECFCPTHCGNWSGLER